MDPEEEKQEDSKVHEDKDVAEDTEVASSTIFLPDENLEVIAEEAKAEIVDLTEESEVSEEYFESNCKIEANVTEAEIEGKKWTVRIIKSGWSKNNTFYPPEVLKRDFKVFENIPIAIYGDLESSNKKAANHIPVAARARITGSEIGSVGMNYVGWAENVRAVDTQEGVDVLADMYLVDDVLKKRLLNAYRLGKKDFLGISIDAKAHLTRFEENGRIGLKVGALPYTREGTLVDRASAGGAILDVAAGIDNKKFNKKEIKSQMWENLIKRLGSVQEGATSEDIYTEAMGKLVFGKSTSGLAQKFADKGDYDSALTVLESSLENSGEKEVTPEPEVKPEVDTKGEIARLLAAEIQKIKEEQQRQIDEMKAEAKQQAEKDKCANVLESVLAQNSNLPEQFRNIIRKNYSGRIFVKEELEAEVASIQEAIGEAGLKIGQGSRFNTGSTSAEKLELEMLRAWGYNFEFGKEKGDVSESDYQSYKSANTLPSFKRTYQEWMGDYDLQFAEQPGYGSVQESTTSDLSYAVANTLGRVVNQRMQIVGNLWSPLVKINPGVSDFRTQTRVRRHGMGGVYSVSESDSADTYTETGVMYDGDAETYSIASHGTMTTFTRKMIINDDMGFIQDIPVALARGYSHFIQEKMFNYLIGNAGGSGKNTDTLADSVVIYHANHRNTGTTAFSHAALNTALEALANQREFGKRTTVSDNPLGSGATTITVASTAGLRADNYVLIEAEIIKIGTVASSTSLTGCSRAQLGTTAAAHAQNSVMWQLVNHLAPTRMYLVYPYEIEDEVFRVLGSPGVSGTGNNDRNRFFAMAGGRMIIPHAVPASYLKDTNDWYLVAMPDELPSIEVAFLNNKQMPEFWTQNEPTVGNVFTRDNIRVKGRVEFGGTVLDWRGLYGSIVS